MNNNVYKILREFEWEEAKQSGQISAALDKKDETQLIYESIFPNEGKRKSAFPHLYSQLMINQILESWNIKRGSFSLPEEVLLQAENLIEE